MDQSQRLALPFILPGQSQKELFHNEALQMLDTIVAAAVEEGPLDQPPGEPVPGCCYIAGAAPTGAWTGHPAAIAAFGPAGWRFIGPFEGLQAWVKSMSTWALYRQGEWSLGELRGSRLLLNGTQVVGDRAGAIANPAGGATIDSEARSAISSMLSAMRQHGLIATE